MKKIILLACVVGLFSFTSAYATCNGGTEVTNTVGTTFCKSNVEMNWWSAAAWCKTNGLRLATMYEMCPSWDGNPGSEKCPELNGASEGYAWSATAYNDGAALGVTFSDGIVDSFNYFRNQEGRSAFCR